MPSQRSPGRLTVTGAQHAIQGEAGKFLLSHLAVRSVIRRRAEVRAEAERIRAEQNPNESADDALAALVTPQDKRELQEAAYRLTGILVPATSQCEGHTAPLDALAEAFFATARVSVWKASRGLGGKTTLLALLAHLEAVLLGAEVSILGGSGQQSQRVHDAQDAFWKYENAPRRLLVREPTTYETELTNGGHTTALMASTRSARGPHPQRLRLDEVDEIALAILDASMGQTMSKRGITAQTVMSSTHQYADGTMTEVLRRAAERGWPVREWCYRENLKPEGWLDQAEVDAKRNEVTLAMWLAEFELQEPSPGSRAIDQLAVEAMFRADVANLVDVPGREIIIEPPIPGAVYATGADWARDVDWTIVMVLRVDVAPWRVVAYLRDGRRPWPLMIAAFDRLVNRYPGKAAHDATGLGKVVEDLITVHADGVQIVGRRRSDLINEYIVEVEGRNLVSARISHPYGEHKYATQDALFGAGHLPDTICAGALAVYAHKHGTAPMAWGAV